MNLYDNEDSKLPKLELVKSMDLEAYDYLKKRLELEKQIVETAKDFIASDGTNMNDYAKLHDLVEKLWELEDE